MFHTTRACLVGLLLAGLCADAGALPQRSLVARPLPPGVLAAAGAGGKSGVLDSTTARTLTDSLLQAVGRARGLEVLRPVPVRVAGRTAVRARLEEITRQDGIEATLRQEQILLRHLGLVPPTTDVVGLYHDLLEEQLAGFYDIDRRELVLADWVPRSAQTVVLEHELVHALQDQHFSLRVRKKLGFDSPDAEASWHALIEGDATAVMLQMDLASSGQSFTMTADSSAAGILGTPAALAAAGGAGSQRFRSAPRAVREGLSYPYAAGMRYVAALHRRGGWRAVDEAFVHPPVSSEQVLHPDRADNLRDAPVRLQIPDLRGVLGGTYKQVATGVMGEHDLEIYLSHYVDSTLARVATAGWGGCSYALYEGVAPEPPVFVLASMWDSEDDAVEFYGGLIGALEARHPKQTGYAEGSSQDQILWNQDPHGKYLNVLRVRERQVLCIEMAPSVHLNRLLGKIEIGMTIDDPSPEMRAQSKADLVWNQQKPVAIVAALDPSLELPAGWTVVPPSSPPDSTLRLEARRGDAHLTLRVDRTAARDIGLDGHAHAIAAALQRNGEEIYVQTDVDYPRPGIRLYQHVFLQVEDTQRVGYWLGVIDLERGYGSLLVTAPVDAAAEIEPAFYSLLDTMTVVPASAQSVAGSSGAASRRP